MQDYYQKSIRALQLAGMSERTQQCHTRSVRQLVDFYSKTPDQINEAQLAPYVFKVAISNSRIIKVENNMVFLNTKNQKAIASGLCLLMFLNLCAVFFSTFYQKAL
jgi:hypothetical protein